LETEDGYEKRDTRTSPSLRRTGSAHSVVRRLFGDLHVVDVALTLTGAADLHELRLGTHFLDGGAADVAHRRAQATHQLVDNATDRAAIRHATFDALGYQFVGIGRILEITVLAALFHRRQRAHAAVALVAATLEQFGFTRRFLGTGKQPADH